MKTIGTRAEVMHNTAKRTSGGLAKSDLMYNKNGRIVSRAKHNSAKREMRLLKYGYSAKKGKFGYVKTTPRVRSSSKSRRSSKRTRRSRMRGGAGLEPADVNSSFMIKEVRAMPFSPLDRALVGGRRRSRRSRRMRGGNNIYNNALSPASLSGSGIDGQGVTDYGASGSNSVQLAAGMAGGRRRRRHRRHRGGTSKVHMQLGTPLTSALNAAS